MPFHELGFSDVAAYQAAGNVTFRSADRAAVDERRIEAALADSYGFAAPTFVRSAAEIESIVASEPFADHDLVGTSGKIQVTFLRAPVPPDRTAAVLALVPPEDRVAVAGRQWYWLPVEGVSTSAVPVGQIERLLGEMTMRTLGTVARMYAKFEH